VNTSGIGAIATALRVLAAVLFAAFNLMPLFGIYAWGWDAFQLLLLYWAETAVLFVCTLVHIACIPRERLGTMIINNRSVPASRAMMVGFFALHGGIFITGHLVFLCVLFSGAAFSRLNGVADFLHTYFVASGAWLPLILVALAGAVDVLTGPYHPAFVDAFARRLHIMLARAGGATGAPAGDAIGSVVLGLYGRIIIMQAAIIFGAMAALRFGTMAPLVIVIGLKTLTDLGTRLSAIFGVTVAPALSAAPVSRPNPD
jgi:Family of unknown function (DUF6498)